MKNLEIKPTISIVLPVHNGERYLYQAIESCIKQTFKEFELIIVDDKSTDNSLKIAQKWAEKDSRIRIITNKTNKKLPLSLNIGFAEAIGKYYTWTSDDNILSENFLEIMLEGIRNNNADIVYSDYIAITEDNREIEVAKVARPENFPLSGGIGASFLYRREVHESLNGFDPSLFLLEDYDFWVRAYLTGFRYVFLECTPYRYRRHGLSLTETAKKKIASGTVKYRYKLREKLKLSKDKAILMRIELLTQGYHTLKIQQTLLLCWEILLNKIKRH